MPPTVKHYFADPTLKQLGFIWNLSRERKRRLIYPTTRMKASIAIEKLLAIKPKKVELEDGFAIELGDSCNFDRAGGGRRAISKNETRKIMRCHK